MGLNEFLISCEPQIAKIVRNFFKKGKFPDEPEIQHSIKIISKDGRQDIWYFREKTIDAIENTYKPLTQTYLGSSQISSKPHKYF